MNTPESLPQVLDEAEYNECIDILRPTHQENNIIGAYIKSSISGLYNLRQNPGYIDDLGWWNACRERLAAQWYNETTVRIMANHIFWHRQRCGREGDEMDDHLKAKYLVELVKYLNQRRTTTLHLRWDPEMEEIVDMVNNIFDTAYFRKLHQPWKSDFECFLEAEREFCEEKEIDFLLERQRLGDRSAAEKQHVEQEIRALAHENYEWRRATGAEGNAVDDWKKAERQYPDWRMKKRIAVICWNISANKRKPQEYYWLSACRAVEELKKRKIGRDANLYDLETFRTIVEILNEGETAAQP